jgi:hypothetical protein
MTCLLPPDSCCCEKPRGEPLRNAMPLPAPLDELDAIAGLVGCNADELCEADLVRGAEIIADDYYYSREIGD